MAKCGNCKAEGVDVAHVRSCYGIATDTAGLPVVTDAPPRVVSFRVGKPEGVPEEGIIKAEDRVYLNVPYDEKDQAKRDFGARFDGARKQWYVKKSADFGEVPKHWLSERRSPNLDLEDGIYCLNRDGVQEPDYYMVYVTRNGHKVTKKLEGHCEPSYGEEDTIGEWVYSGTGPLRDLNPEDKLDPEQAARFGQVYGWCGICGRTLTNEESKKLGIGPICRDKAGL